MKGYEEEAFVAARGETIGFLLREEEVLRTATTGGGEGGATTTKREVSSGEGGGGGGDENGGIVERGEEMVGADVAPLLVEETTVIETMIVEEMENEENTEEKQKDVEAEEEETRERMVLKTDSGTEVDLAKLKSAADVAPEMGGYLKKLQHQLSILLGGGSRSSD